MKMLKGFSNLGFPPLVITAALLHLSASTEAVQQNSLHTPNNLHIAQAAQGTVEGTIQYPSDILPAMQVCAQSTSNAYLMSCLNTEEFQSSFSLSLPPGEYYFFAYEEDAYGDGRGAFLFHSVGGYRAGGSNAPAPVRVSTGLTSTGVVTNNPWTCTEYSQYCVTPPRSISTASGSTQSDSKQAETLPDRIENLNGTWEGTYVCSQGLTNLQVIIEAGSTTDIDAVFQFSEHPQNPGVPSGRFRMEGNLEVFDSPDIPDLLVLTGTTWINRPSGYSTVDLRGDVSASGRQISGNVDHPGCRQFEIFKQ